MGKVKQWAEDTAEKAVDNIIDKWKKSGKFYNSVKIKEEILAVSNVNLLGIDGENVDELVEEHFGESKKEYLVEKTMHELAKEFPNKTYIELEQIKNEKN
jgi:hypothetical protein|tara:strand:- start:582 stop:881 length:300 start_codon:yes stop_codon:yes gene_type:complete